MLNLRLLPLAAAVIVLVAACGGSTSSAPTGGSAAPRTPGGSVAAASLPVAGSPAVAASAAPSLAGQPSAQPSAPVITGTHADPALEALLPAAVGGTPLARSSVSLATMLDSGANRPAIDAFLGSIGKSEGDGSVALAVDPSGVVPGGISAFKVTGADATALLGGLVAVERSDLGAGATVAQATVGGKAVTVLTIGNGVNDNTWVYGHGDVVFVVKAPDAARAAAFLELLP